MGGKSGSLSGILSAARFFFEASFDCFFRTLVSLAKESSLASPFLDWDELEELEDEVEDEVDEEDGVTPSVEEEDEEVELLEDDVLEIKLDELELDEPSSSSDEFFRSFLCPFFFFFTSFLFLPESRLRCFLSSLLPFFSSFFVSFAR